MLVGFVGILVVEYPLAVFGCGLLMVLGEVANVEGQWEGLRSGFWISLSQHEAQGEIMADTLSMYST